MYLKYFCVLNGGGKAVALGFGAFRFIMHQNVGIFRSGKDLGHSAPSPGDAPAPFQCSDAVTAAILGFLLLLPMKGQAGPSS
jgi:hypothetical protein